MINLSQIKELVINDSRLKFFDTTPFTSLEYLSIDESVKLTELIVNSSLMKEFSYNSSELQSIKFVNNTMMTLFHNSNLPNVTNISIILTNFQSF